MSDAKLYTLDELKKMSEKDRNKLMLASQAEVALTVQSIRTGKEKRSHLKGQWEKQISQIQTLNNQSASNAN
jgi:ribosomal protein L29